MRTPSQDRNFWLVAALGALLTGTAWPPRTSWSCTAMWSPA